MNRGALNGHAINGRVSDLVVRVKVSAKGYARIRANGRVLASTAIACAPRVQTAGALGRVEASLQVDALMQAAISGALGHASVRSLVKAKGRAVLDISLPPLGARIYSTPTAAMHAGGWVQARQPLKLKAKAKGVPVQRVMRRVPVGSVATAAIQVNPTIYTLRPVRSPVELKARVLVGVAGSVHARLSALCAPQAVPQIESRALVRAPVLSCAVVQAIIDTSIYKQLPFDEQAPEARTFYVPAGVHTFYVVN